MGTIVSPIVARATRNVLYACCGDCRFGMASMTFLLTVSTLWAIAKFRHVNPVAQVTSSLSSISGLNEVSTAPTGCLQRYTGSSASSSAAATRPTRASTTSDRHMGAALFEARAKR